MRFFPLGIDLRDTACVVVGGGRIATRKAEALLDAGARVTVIAPHVSSRLAALERERAGALQLLAEPFRAELLGRPRLVVAATDDQAVNQAVAAAAHELGALVCDASSAERTQVIFGALHHADDITLAVFTNGQDPALARRTRDRLAPLAAAAARAEPGAAGAEDPGESQLIVVAHGSRDPRWRASMEAVVQAVQAEAGRESVALAYMDRAAPTLPEAVDAAVRAGVRRLRVLPLFLAPEGHVDRDIRPLVEQVRAAHPGITIRFLPPIGQLPGFRELLLALARGLTDDGSRGDPPVGEAPA